LLEQSVEIEERDLGKQPMSAHEIEELIGDRNYLDFMNTRNEQYREMNMKENPPSRSEAIRLMSQNPNLIRRPIFRVGKEFVIGFDVEKVSKLLQ
jgi:arsenate reductase